MHVYCLNSDFTRDDVDFHPKPVTSRTPNWFASVIKRDFDLFNGDVMISKLRIQRKQKTSAN